MTGISINHFYFYKLFLFIPISISQFIYIYIYSINELFLLLPQNFWDAPWTPWTTSDPCGNKQRGWCSKPPLCESQLWLLSIICTYLYIYRYIMYIYNVYI